MKRGWRNHSSSFKAKVAMEALKGEQAMAERPASTPISGCITSIGLTKPWATGLGRASSLVTQRHPGNQRRRCSEKAYVVDSRGTAGPSRISAFPLSN